MMRAAGVLLAVVLAAGWTAGCSQVRIPEAPTREDGRARSLPLRPLPAPAGSTGRAFAVVLTGDGPAGGIGKLVARDLSSAGVPSVVWQSLRYYWTPRTPEEASRDLDAVVRHYAALWGRDRVVLVGYSMGADVLPFLVNRLPADTRARIGGVALLALAHDAVFEFRVEQWWGTSGAPRWATRPEVERLAGLPVLCVWARGDEKAACPRFGTAPVRIVGLTGGHHFDGDRARLLRVVRDLALEANDAASR